MSLIDVYNREIRDKNLERQRALLKRPETIRGMRQGYSGNWFSNVYNELRRGKEDTKSARAEGDRNDN